MAVPPAALSRNEPVPPDDRAHPNTKHVPPARERLRGRPETFPSDEDHAPAIRDGRLR